jgi:hypothetical protein
VSFNTCGFDTNVLHHITVVKCINDYPKIILDAGWSQPWSSFLSLHAHLTWIRSVFSLWVFKNQFLCQHSKIQQYASDAKNTLATFGRLRISLSRMSCVPVNTEAISSTSCKEVKVWRILIGFSFIFLTHTLFNLPSILGITMKAEIRIAVTF